MGTAPIVVVDGPEADKTVQKTADQGNSAVRVEFFVSLHYDVLHDNLLGYGFTLPLNGS